MATLHLDYLDDPAVLPKGEDPATMTLRGSLTHFKNKRENLLQTIKGYEDYIESKRQVLQEVDREIESLNHAIAVLESQ